MLGIRTPVGSEIYHNPILLLVDAIPLQGARCRFRILHVKNN